MAELTDEKIMYSIQDGELSGLTRLFDRYHTAVYRFFLKLTANADTSEDLTQAVFYRLLRYRHTFNESNGSFRSWMYQVARNLHADHCREASRTGRMIKSVDSYPEDVPEGQDGFKEQDFEQLKKAMAGLSPDDRELIVLSRYEGLKYAEIARIKNLSLGAVKVQIHRAIKELRILYFKQQEL